MKNITAWVRLCESGQVTPVRTEEGLQKATLELLSIGRAHNLGQLLIRYGQRATLGIAGMGTTVIDEATMEKARKAFDAAEREMMKNQLSAASREVNRILETPPHA